MTKLEALLQFSNYRKRDTWVIYGQPQYPISQTEFMKDDIFQLIAPGTIWDNAIFFCTEELHLTELVPWASYTFENKAKGTIWDTNYIIHPSLHCVLTGTEFSAIAEPIDPTFIAFAALDSVDIDDTTLDTILLEAGIPFITLEELEFTRDQILNLMIKPAIEEYYKWFPIRITEQFPMGSYTINIPIPPYVKGVERVYINPGVVTSGDIQNPLVRYFDEVILSSSSRGSFANPSINYRQRQPFVDLQAYSTFLLEKAVRQGTINNGTRKRVRVEKHNNRIVGYVNLKGVLEVEWTSLSYNWDDIPFNRQSEVREFATAKVLRALGTLRSQANSSLPGSVSFENFNTRANELETKILTLWKESAKIVIVRG